MKIAVIQHRLRPTPAQDLEALVIVSARAASLGAELIVLPDARALHDGPLANDLFRRIAEDAPGAEVLSVHRDSGESPGPVFRGVTSLGDVCVLTGDWPLDASALSPEATRGAGVLVLAPGAESDLQAQAVLELAVGLSTSLASLVVVVETDGADVGEPGHGGSAIIHLGEVLAEAMAGDDLLMAEVATPLGPPEAPAALPAVPIVLEQRLAAHRGRKLDVGYPADLD